MTAPEGIRVRAATRADLDQVSGIERVAFSDPWPDSALRDELTCDWLRLGIVAVDGDEVLGYAMSWRLYEQLHVLNIAVHPDHRQRGIGSMLLEHSMRAGAGWGLQEITLEVRASNASARAFYVRHGFEETGRRKAFYRDNGEDAIIMTRALPGGD